MPRRRVTTKQKAASRRNLAIARAKREGRKPTGKSTLLFHRTSPANADSIAKHGFDPGRAVKGSVTRSKADRSVFFSDKRSGESSRYGKALVSVKVPRKLVKRDPNYDTYKGETFHHVRVSDLAGRKIKRHM